MNKKLTSEQKKSIKDLEKAFKKCGQLGITFCGMDDSIIWVTNEAIKSNPGDGGNNYCYVADCYRQIQYDYSDERRGQLNIGDIYQDSGGW